MEKVYFSKLNANAIIPSKRVEDAGYDIYACFEEDYIIINPHETKFISTGIASAFSQNYVGIIKERGSTGIKGIGQRAGIIDSGYRGEWFIGITNHNTSSIIISKTEKHAKFNKAIIYPYTKALAQCIFLEIPQLEICELSPDELLKIKSERGTGNKGSSQK